MTAARKVIALLIIIFFGIPILFGVIWFVGLTKASVSPEFLTDLPRQIIADIPDMAEEIFTEAQSERVISDENTRAWFRAAAEAGVTPTHVLEETGLEGWLRNELSETLYETGEVLRGKRRARTIVLDLRPLKEILLREDIDSYIMRILEQLPPCDEEGREAWMEFAEEGWEDEWPPACRPDLDIAREVVKYELGETVGEIEDEIEIFEDAQFIPFGISRVITWFSYSLFLIPAFFIFIGALIAATSPASFFRWTGVSILFAGIPALLLSFFIRSVSLWALNFVPYSYSHAETWSAELNDLIMEKTSWIPVLIIEHLFSPVVAVAGTVCIIGLVIFVISFMVRDRVQRRIIERQVVAPPPEPTEESPQKEENFEEGEEQSDQVEEKADEADERAAEKKSIQTAMPDQERKGIKNETEKIKAKASETEETEDTKIDPVGADKKEK